MRYVRRNGNKIAFSSKASNLMVGAIPRIKTQSVISQQFHVLPQAGLVNLMALLLITPKKLQFLKKNI